MEVRGMPSISMSICFQEVPSSLLFRREPYQYSLPPLSHFLPKEGAIYLKDNDQEKGHCYVQWCDGKCLVTGFGTGGGALICSMCQFPWCTPAWLISSHQKVNQFTAFLQISHSAPASHYVLAPQVCGSQHPALHTSQISEPFWACSSILPWLLLFPKVITCLPKLTHIHKQ